MAKYALDGGWKFPLYEFVWMLIGGGLVGAGVLLGMYSRNWPPVLADAPSSLSVETEGAPAGAASIEGVTEQSPAEALGEPPPEATTSIETPAEARVHSPAETPSSTKKKTKDPFYSLQLGVYLSKSAALSHIKSLEKKKLAAFTVARMINDRELNYVYVGRFPAKPEALKYQAQLEQEAGLKSVLFQFVK